MDVEEDHHPISPATPAKQIGMELRDRAELKYRKRVFMVRGETNFWTRAIPMRPRKRSHTPEPVKTIKKSKRSKSDDEGNKSSRKKRKSKSTSDSEKVDKKKKRKSDTEKGAKSKSPKKSFENMVLAAIEENGSRKGASRKAIYAYISENYEVPQDFRVTAAKSIRDSVSTGLLIKNNKNYKINLDSPKFKKKSRSKKTLKKKRPRSKSLGDTPSEKTGKKKRKSRKSATSDSEKSTKKTKRKSQSNNKQKSSSSDETEEIRPERASKAAAKIAIRNLFRQTSHPFISYTGGNITVTPSAPKTPITHSVAPVRTLPTRSAAVPFTYRPLQNTSTNTAGIEQAIVEWRYDSGSPAFGISVDKITNMCWMGNQNGHALCLDHNGKEIIHKMKLSSGIKCVVSDSHWHYACTDDGKVYDLTSGTPRVAYELPQTTPPKKEVVFVLDYSGSMMGKKITASIANIETIYREHCKDEDLVSFIRFSHIPTVVFSKLQKATSDTLILSQFRTSTRPTGGTRIFDALHAAWNQFTDAQDVARWVVCLTDGHDVNSHISAETIKNKAATTGANVIIISVDVLHHEACEMICKATPKGVFLPVSTDGIDDAFKIVSQLMSGQALWLDIRDGILCISGAFGDLTACNIEGEVIWQTKSEGTGGWMARATFTHVYHGHSEGVTKYEIRSGTKIWNQKSSGQVLFGSMLQDRLYVSSQNVVESWNLEGSEKVVYQCDAAVVSNASEEEGHVFAADANQCLYCFEKDGTRKWKVKTGLGSALSMAYHKGHLYIVTTQGILACLDFTKQGKPSNPEDTTHEVLESDTLQEVAVSASVDTTNNTSGRILVECVSEGSKLRIRPVSAGFNTDWNVQFPRNIRKEGARYVVDELVTAVGGGFYRAKGAIHELETATKNFRIFDIATTVPLNQFIRDQGLVFEKGRAYYQFIRDETVQKYKKLVIMDKITREIYEGDAVRDLLNLPKDQDVTVSPQSIGRYFVFIQSTSANRNLHPGTIFLFCTS